MIIGFFTFSSQFKKLKILSNKNDKKSRYFQSFIFNLNVIKLFRNLIKLV